MKSSFFSIRHFFISIVLFFTAFSLYGADGVLWGEKDIRVLQTQWFDIIYPSDSSNSAALLYENADRIYYEIAEMYGREPVARLPVVLSPKTEEFNAYFSCGFYNLIVLYDTAPEESMMVFSNDLLSTFRHELTHAYSYNMKSPFWQTVGKIFGDAVNPAGLSITSGWSEGATMTSEAFLGEGRLHNEYSNHLVRQAKVENKFPEYADVQGASDKYPWGSFYYFNGAFNQWLQEKYGMEKYAAFWYRCVNMQSVTAGGAFKKVYGISLKSAWNNFKDEIPVPAIQSHPFHENDKFFSPADFFDGSRIKFSKENEDGSIFSSLTACSSGFAYIEEISDSVWFVPNEDFSSSVIKPKKLWALSGVSKINLSQDGRYMAVSYKDTASPTYLSKVKIFDMQNHRWLEINESGLRDSVIIQDGSEYFLVSLGIHSQKKWIDVKKISAKAVQNIKTIALEKNDVPFSFIQSGDGELSYILRSGLSYKICVSSVKNIQDKLEIIEEINLPYERMIISGFSQGEENGKFVFSWTRPGSFPRLGFYNRRTKSFELLEKDISGGIYEPVFVNSEIIYAGHFFRQNRLFRVRQISELNEICMECAEIENVSINPEFPVENYVELSGNLDEILAASKKYNVFNYVRKGLLVPLSLAASENFNPDIRNETRTISNFGEKIPLPLGASYLTNNPWSSNTFTATAGYNPFTNSFGFEFQVNGGTDTSLFKWDFLTGTEFDMAGYKQAKIISNQTVRIPVAKYSHIGFSNQVSIYEGRSNSFEQDLFNSGSREDRTLWAGDSLDFWYSNVHRTGPGLFEYGGMQLGIEGVAAYYRNLEETMKYAASLREKMIYSVSPYISVYVPKLIPVSSRNFYVYNLPFAMGATLFPSVSGFVSAAAKVYLFSMDVQKAIPFVTCLFLNRFYVTLGYSFLAAYDNVSSSNNVLFSDVGVNLKKLWTGALPVFESAVLSFNFGLTPNVGIIANSNFYEEIQAQLVCDFGSSTNGKMKITGKIGFKGFF